MNTAQKLVTGVRQWLSGSVKTTTTYTGTPGFWGSFGLVSPSATGKTLTPTEAFGIGVVYACVTKISETLAALPIYLYNDTPGNFDRIQSDTDYLLNKTPDGNITAYDFRRSLVALSLLYGKGWARIIRGRGGDAVELQLIHPDRVTEGMADGVPTVSISRKDDEPLIVPMRDMICVKQILGVSPVDMNAETISIMDAAQKYAAGFFAGGGMMNGILSSDMNLNKDQIDTLVESFGSQSGSQTKFLPYGVKYQRLGVDPDTAQNVEGRELQGAEICRIFGIPPAIMGFAGGAYKDYENQMKSFVGGTLLTHCENLEAEIALKLVPINVRRTSTFRHDMNELLRADSAGRASYYSQMVQGGIISRNEARGRERMNPVEGGDVLTAQVNQIDIKKLEAYSEKIASAESGDTPGNTGNDG